MNDNTAFTVTLAGIVVLVWSWPILAKARDLLISKLRAHRERLERKDQP